jgi:hypothetical protein
MQNPTRTHVRMAQKRPNPSLPEGGLRPSSVGLLAGRVARRSSSSGLMAGGYALGLSPRACPFTFPNRAITASCAPGTLHNIEGPNPAILHNSADRGDTSFRS